MEDHRQRHSGRARAGDAEPEHHRRKLPDIDADRSCGVAIRRSLVQI
jgi:hypothetical protein